MPPGTEDLSSAQLAYYARTGPKFTSTVQVTDLPALDVSARTGPLYKFLVPQHAEAMVDKGQLRIGTLYEYQDEEKYGEKIGDKAEGVKRLRDDTGAHTIVTGADANELVKKAVGLKDDGFYGITFLGIGFEVEWKCDDMLLYCLANSDAREIRAHFAAEGRTACVRIDDTERFFDGIDDVVRQHRAVTQFSVGRCVYDDRERRFAGQIGVHPALLKPRSYADQREVRGMWTVSELPAVPMIIPECHAIVGTCTLV